jgi:hypothetical protein
MGRKGGKKAGRGDDDDDAPELTPTLTGKKGSKGGKGRKGKRGDISDSDDDEPGAEGRAALKGKKNSSLLNGQKDAPPPALMDVDPTLVRYTHSKIRPFFSGCGRKVLDVVDDLLEGRTKVDALPLIMVVVGRDGHQFSMNNRRLFLLKAMA